MCGDRIARGVAWHCDRRGAFCCLVFHTALGRFVQVANIHGGTGLGERGFCAGRDRPIWGIHPVNGSSSGPIVSMLNPATRTFSYKRRRTALSGIVYTVWTSNNLQNWTQDTGATQVAGTPVGDVETVTVTLSPGLPVSPRIFVRVRATE